MDPTTYDALREEKEYKIFILCKSNKLYLCDKQNMLCILYLRDSQACEFCAEVSAQNSHAGVSPKRKNITFRTRRMCDIKKIDVLFYSLHSPTRCGLNTPSTG